MASTLIKCAYVKCDASFWGGKRAKYCPDKHCGTYQRRLDKAKLNDSEIQKEVKS